MQRSDINRVSYGYGRQCGAAPGGTVRCDQHGACKSYYVKVECLGQLVFIQLVYEMFGIAAVVFAGELAEYVV